MDIVDLNTRGERFVFSKLQELGWIIDFKDCGDIDVITLKKDDKNIKIQIKTILNKNKTYLSEIAKTFDFDYLIITNLEKCWVIPKLLCKTIDTLKTFSVLEEKWSLLEFSGYFLVNELNDLKIPYFLMDKAVLFKISSEMKVGRVF